MEEALLIVYKDEAVQTIQELQLFSLGEGGVDPSARIASGDISADSVRELAERVQTDEFYDDIPQGSIPCVCMDCRLRLDGDQELGGNAAGGTFTLVMADALTYNSFRHPGENAVAHAKRMYDELRKDGNRVGGHDADNVANPDANGGCGAQDKLDSMDESAPSVLRFMVNRADDVRQVVQSFGFEVSDEVHQAIVANAVELRQTGYAANGREICEATKEVAGEDSVETLTGPQLAVLAVANTRPDQTLNRKKVAAEYGAGYEVFNIDVPTIINGANKTSISEVEQANRTIAALYYNVSTAAVIVGPGMPFVVR